MTNVPVFPNATLTQSNSNQLLCPLIIDVEEDFDWQYPKSGTPFSTTHARNLSDFEDILSAYGAVPTYLTTYPILNDPDAVRTLRRRAELGRCILGIQLHTWVTPPITDIDHRVSFATNLAVEIEEQKLLALKNKFFECFGQPPKIFRAGRYGISSSTLALLERHGFLVDTSLAPHSNFTAEGGPDFSTFNYGVFWFGEHRRLLEIPLCRALVGWGGQLADLVYRAMIGESSTPYLASFLTRIRFSERITLSPEGNDSGAMQRLARSLVRRGEHTLALSLHSSSLAVGRNPYVRTQQDLHALYEVLSATLDFMASKLHAQFPTPLEIYDRLSRSSGE